VRNKRRAADKVGIRAFDFDLPEGTTEAELLALIDRLNADPDVHGILVQLPLPGIPDARRLIHRIDPRKDVDGFSVHSAGQLMTGLPGLRPATPYGCMKLIESTGTVIKGKHAVVIGRSNTVGKPMALLLLQAHATVTVCHSRTHNLAAITRQADILIVAIGQARFVTADMVRPGAVVVDVGINRTEQGLCGDVDFTAVAEVASHITPVPGGVGPLTITMLLKNTLTACREQATT